MIVYDANKLQRTIVDNNDQYEYEINKKISMFKQTLLSEIEEIFKYYRIYVSLSSIETLLNDITFSIKNNLGYKKIIIIISDAISELLSSSQNKAQILKEAFERQNLINRQIDLNDSFIELKRNFSNLDINQATLNEILSAIKRRLIFLQTEVGELTNLYIKTNKSKIEKEMREVDVDINVENKNIINILNKCQKAVNELDEDKAIVFLQNEFSMLNNDEINLIITAIVRQMPFGVPKLEQFLKEKKEEVQSNNSVNLERNTILLGGIL